MEPHVGPFSGHHGMLRLLLLLVITVLTSPVHSLTSDVINTFEVNWKDEKAKSAPDSIEFTPPSSDDSTFQFVAGRFGPCTGCGSKSFKSVEHDCIHRLPINLTMGGYSKSLYGVFKVPDNECFKRKRPYPKPVSMLGCGPPCSSIRLLRGENTGWRCDRLKRLAYNAPRLVCQDNRNRTVSLSLCKFHYERSVQQYQAGMVSYEALCNVSSEWLTGNWSACSLQKNLYQSRDVACAAKPSDVYTLMHESECPAASRPPTHRYCARWAAEKSFKCDCLNYNASRIVLCLRGRGRRRSLVDSSECRWHEKPVERRVCTDSERRQCRRGR